MRGRDADTRVAALEAIVQTLVLEHYWEENEADAKWRFIAMAEADHPLAMAVVNELTEEELDAAFRWPRAANEGECQGPPATPVMAFLTAEQYERVRISTVAENEGDRARELAMNEPGGPAGRTFSATERVRIAERQFVSAMVHDVARHRGARPHTGASATTYSRSTTSPPRIGRTLERPTSSNRPSPRSAIEAPGPKAASPDRPCCR